MSRRILLIDIGSGLTLTGVLPSVALYADYSARLIAGGGTAPYTFTLASGALPAGLYLDAATGVISGSPTAAGSFPITVRVTDLSGTTVVRAFAVQVIAEPLTLSGAAPDGTVGVAQSYTYTVAGGVPPYTFELVDAPDGWSVPDATMPTIDYTPASGGAQSWTLRATDSDGTTFDLVDTAMITAPALTLTGTFADATIGTPYSSDLAIAGGDGVYSNPRLTAGSLAGTGLALSIVGSALRLSGTPTGSAQTLDITVAVDSGDGQTASSAQSIAVSEALAAYPYWRLFISANNGSAYTAIEEIEFYVGANKVAPQQATASSESDINGRASKVFDGNKTDVLSAWVASTSDLTPFIELIYVSAHAFDSVKLWPQARSDLVNRSPKDFLIQGSANGMDWTTVKSVTGMTNWVVGTPKVIVIP